MPASIPGFRPAAALPRGFTWSANLSSLVLLLAILAFAWLDPPGFADSLRKDSEEGGGLFERLPSVVLLPGILAGLYAYRRFRQRLPRRLLGWWLLAWVLACIYFAGEEENWGQWYFGWRTPASVARVNAQKEANLHNMSSWLNEKPRVLVELFIVVGGFVIPLSRLLGSRAPIFRRSFLAVWEPWLYAPAACTGAGLLFVVVRIARGLPEYFPPNFGDSELREFCIAWFLMWYLLSYYVRLSRAEAV